jgi:hypothetical protein
MTELCNISLNGRRKPHQPGDERIKFDLSNKRFGRWTVLAIHPERYRWKNPAGMRQTTAVLWLCRCDCGTERAVFGISLRNGRSQSCGCVGRKKRTKHGLSRSRAYKVWSAMKDRCLNPRNHAYDRYGGRGISISEEWLSFETFYADMLDPPPGLSIDRINNEGGYELGNCRWADSVEQTQNRRPRKRIAVKRRQRTPEPSSLDVDPPFYSASRS